MKKIMIVVISAVLMGCSDFLEEKSQSEVRPSTIVDMEKIMEGTAYFSDAEGHFFNFTTEIFTDDIECNEKDRDANAVVKKEDRRWFFSWDRTMFDEQGGGEELSLWTVPYECIMGCNVVLDYVDEMTGNEQKKLYVKGEAHALRGFYYWMLVNFFGWPYNDGDPSSHLGVPLKLHSAATDELFNRNTVAEVYAQVEKDLLTGAQLMRENPQKQDMTRLNHLAAYALLSRMYLHMNEWDKVIAYADTVLAEKSELLYLVDVRDGSVYDRGFDVEILWAGNLNNMMYDYISTYSKDIFIPSSDLVNLYGQDVDNEVIDMRMNVDSTNSYFLQGSSFEGEIWIAGVQKSYNSKLSGGIRTAEVYLNRAEAYARKYVLTGEAEYGMAALEDLNLLREYRFDVGYVDKELSDFATAEELLDFCLRERRRELVHEANSRWFDLRRLGMPRIEHDYWLNDELEVFVLEEKDERYVLPIPEKIIEQNPNLRQN